MTGIFYDASRRRLCVVQGAGDPAWTLVTHNLHAGPHQCRRIMREWLAFDELGQVDWSAVQRSA